MIQLLLLISVLWIGLAIAVGVHADGHNRSTLFWFGVTLVAGLFGVLIYLLVITSRGTKDPATGIETSREFAYVFAAVGGVVAASASAFAFTWGLGVMTLPPITDPGYRVSPLTSTYPPIIVGAAICGLVGGVLAFQNGGTNRLFALLSYAPAVIVGLVAFPLLVSQVGEIEGLFYGGYRMALAPIALVLPAVLFAGGWRVVRSKIPVVRSWSEQSDRGSVSIVDRRRRELLGVAGVATIPFVGYGVLGENPHREAEIRDNEVIVRDGFELSDLSYGYFEQDDEYRVTGTVTTTDDTFMASADIEWFVGTGIGLGTTTLSLDFGLFGDDPAELEAVVDGEDSFYSFEPSEIERFELEIYDGRY